MTKMNAVIADNITKKLQECGKKQSELAEALNVNQQTMSEMLSGGRMINAVELSQIAAFFNTSMEDLFVIPEDEPGKDVIHIFMEEVNSEAAKEALEIIDELADLIIFHARVRENAEEMMKPLKIE